MSNTVIQNLIRLFFFVLIQAIVLQQIQLGGSSFNYISLFIYPLFLLLLPLKTSKISLVLIGFGVGILIDLCYNSPGVHTAASLVTAILRPFVLAILTPREGYHVKQALTVQRYGMLWFLKYSGVLYFIHLLIYFILEVFTPIYTIEILLRTIFSFIFSMMLVFVYIFLFRPKA